MDLSGLPSHQPEFRYSFPLSRYLLPKKRRTSGSPGPYRQGKVNGTADALSRFSQRGQDVEDALRTENTRILHYLQSLLTNASLSGLSLSSPTSLTPLHQVLLCETHVLPQLCQFCATLRGELAGKGPYRASISGMRLRLEELQNEDERCKTIRAEELGKEAGRTLTGCYTTKGFPTYVPPFNHQV